MRVEYRDRSLFGGNRELAIQRDGERCVKCGMNRAEHRAKYGKDITVDHIDGRGYYKPKEERNNNLDNLQTLCFSCHGNKDHRTPSLVDGRRRCDDCGYRRMTRLYVNEALCRECAGKLGYPASRNLKKTCKFGHLKVGENLLLRPRHRIDRKRLTNGTVKRYEFDYAERVCRICLEAKPGQGEGV